MFIRIVFIPTFSWHYFSCQTFSVVKSKQSGTENYIYVDLGICLTIYVAFECFRKYYVDYS